MTQHEIVKDVDLPVLYHSGMSVCAAKVRMLLALKDIAWQGRLMDLRAGDAQSPEYVRLNPKQVVPTFVADDDVIIESNVILEYIDERWPSFSCRPDDPGCAARMRLWMRQLDEDVHAATAVVSICVAFRHQFLQRGPDAIRQWIGNMVDPVRQERSRAAIEKGMEAPQFGEAVRRIVRLLDDFEWCLAESSWLAGDSYSLAEIAYAPYMLRLDHLGFADVIEARPHLAAWRNRLYSRPEFQAGVTEWLNEAAVKLLERQRPGACQRIVEIIGSESFATVFAEGHRQ